MSMYSEEVYALYAQMSPDGTDISITRGYELLIPGKRGLVVEDILTTGGSARKVIESVRALNGQVIGVGALCNRGGVMGVMRKDLGDVPKLHSLVNMRLEAWSARECPLCKAGMAIDTSIGKGRKYLRANGPH